jgi:hypothetical protein
MAVSLKEKPRKSFEPFCLLLMTLCAPFEREDFFSSFSVRRVLEEGFKVHFHCLLRRRQRKRKGNCVAKANKKPWKREIKGNLSFSFFCFLFGRLKFNEMRFSFLPFRPFIRCCFTPKPVQPRTEKKMKNNPGNVIYIETKKQFSNKHP